MHNHFGRLVASAGSNARVRGTSVTISAMLQAAAWESVQDYFKQ